MNGSSACDPCMTVYGPKRTEKNLELICKLLKPAAEGRRKAFVRIS